MTIEQHKQHSSVVQHKINLLTGYEKLSYLPKYLNVCGNFNKSSVCERIRRVATV